MLIYAIHSGNSRLIRMIEDELAAGQEEEENYKDFFVESTKCHHNEIADYMCYKIDENERLSLSLEFHNFYSFSAEEISNILMEKLFYIACKYVNITVMYKILKQYKKWKHFFKKFSEFFFKNQFFSHHILKLSKSKIYQNAKRLILFINNYDIFILD